MSAAILGCGWVTPLGGALDGVTRAVMDESILPLAGANARPTTPDEKFLSVPDADIAGVSRLPRLRRASRISHLSMTAALAALADADVDPGDPEIRLSLVFSVSDGGVIYTRKFFSDLVDRGTQAGSPLLFPETVYNAPLSHMAAKLGLDGTTSTVVGDSTSAIHAIAMAEDLLASHDCTHCLVVAAEEMDAVVIDAYGMWGLGRACNPVFSEGASAILLGSQGPCHVSVDAGGSYKSISDASDQLARSLRSVAGDETPELVIGSASGSSFDTAERAAIAAVFGDVAQRHPRSILGESFAASTLAQIIVALRQAGGGRAVPVSVLGWNGQCASALVRHL